jgi:phosphate transport system permease protein
VAMTGHGHAAGAGQAAGGYEEGGAPSEGNAEGTAPRTFVRAAAALAPPASLEDRVRTGASREDVLTVAGAAAAAVSLALLTSPVLAIITPGWIPMVALVWFTGIYSALTFVQDSAAAMRDRFWTVIFWACAIAVGATLVLVIAFVLVRGWPVYGQMLTLHGHRSLLQRFHFILQDGRSVGSDSGLGTGGISYAIVGTVEQIGIALVFTIPFGLATAVFLSEVGGRFARFVRTITEAMTALPAVVAGLFIWAAYILVFTREYSGFAGALALTVLMLPITIRSADVVLRLAPGNLREAGLALGASQWSTVRRVVLPTVRSGLVTAVILATAHGIGETAPVLLTTGVTTHDNFNPFSGNQTSLPLAALEYIELPSRAALTRGFATAAFLLVLVLALFALARATAGRDLSQERGGRARRLTARSGRTRRRIAAAPARAAAQLALHATSARRVDEPRPASGDAAMPFAFFRDDRDKFRTDDGNELS